jgi:hypothetical protein
MRIRTIATATVLGLALTACAGGTAGSGNPSPTGIAHPTSPDRSVLTLSYDGGFVAPQVTITRFPRFALYGDGTLITAGAQNEIYPQQALPPVLAQTVDERGMQAILRAAMAAGLAEAPDMTDLDTVGIADAATTVFTIDAGGIQRTVRVYALGTLSGERPAGMVPAQFKARQQLQHLVEQLGALRDLVPVGSLTAAHPYRARGARVYVSDYRGDTTLREPPIAWPLSAEPLATFGMPLPTGQSFRCGVVQGEEWTGTLEPAVAGASQLTPWTDAGGRFAIAFRPLMPDETSC